MEDGAARRFTYTLSRTVVRLPVAAAAEYYCCFIALFAVLPCNSYSMQRRTATRHRSSLSAARRRRSSLSATRHWIHPPQAIPPLRDRQLERHIHEMVVRRHQATRSRTPVRRRSVEPPPSIVFHGEPPLLPWSTQPSPSSLPVRVMLPYIRAGVAEVDLLACAASPSSPLIPGVATVSLLVKGAALADVSFVVAFVAGREREEIR